MDKYLLNGPSASLHCLTDKDQKTAQASLPGNSQVENAD